MYVGCPGVCRNLLGAQGKDEWLAVGAWEHAIDLEAWVASGPLMDGVQC